LFLPSDVTAKDWSFEQEFIVLKVDLVAEDLDGAVSEDKEEIPGAYVHYNIDDDNLNEMFDKDEIDFVEGEDDLKFVRIITKPVSLNTGFIILKRSDSKIRVWKQKNKGSDKKILVDVDRKRWDLSNSEERAEVQALFWAEGYEKGTSGLTVEYRDKDDNLVCSDMVKYTFIAADCGRQPDTTERVALKFAFKKLVDCEWSITKEVDLKYNCIAWSVEETKVWYDPISNNLNDPVRSIVGIDEEFGNKNSELELSDMDAFYNYFGYEPTTTGPEDADIMYYSKFHAARKRECNCGVGKWIMFESKCGEMEQIEHVDDQLNDGPYGDPIKYYKKT